MSEYNAMLYDLSTGKTVSTLTPFSSPLDEYRNAFENRAQLFLNYYTFPEGKVNKLTLTRGEFWTLACLAAAYLNEHGLLKGDRLVHAFSANNLYDLVFRLAAILTGCVPVTINWQADDSERIIYKAKVAEAKLMLYDAGFAARIEEVKPELWPMLFLDVATLKGFQATSPLAYPALSYDDERMIIFTSGTTGTPKGVSLSQRSFLANRLTFEHYFEMSGTTQLDLFLTNPLHHINSSVLSDWGMRRGGTVIHLLQRYSTVYWKILAEASSSKRDLFVAPIVSRHIDFLKSLSTQSKLPMERNRLKGALGRIDFLIGSAPVGPITIKRILEFSNRLPHVRFGSTETSLQAMATPIMMPENTLMEVFEAGWSHCYKGEETIGFYIGREHFPFTRVKVVKSVEPESDDFMCPCEIGEPGYLVTQGANIMSGYVGDTKATKAAFMEGWYTGLRDIAFTLKNKKDGQLDYYWMARDSELLIRGGANYAYDQIAAELSKFVVENYHLKPEQFQLAVVGLRSGSEHEDSCCATIELSKEVASIEPQLKADFVEKASTIVSKGARPDYLRFAIIPRNFKGAILYLQLKQDFNDMLKHSA